MDKASLSKIRQIAEQHSCSEVEGVLVDAYSAGMFINVFDRLNEQNKARLASLPVVAAVELAYKVAA